jgi:hypothetical protein
MEFGIELASSHLHGIGVEGIPTFDLFGRSTATARHWIAHGTELETFRGWRLPLISEQGMPYSCL